ncbi:MAG: hypothetical protein MHM6MM_002241 [Cercozoa sp. M6MM]
MSENIGANGPSRDLQAAREAYELGDLEASKQAHNANGFTAVASQENHSTEQGKYIKSIVFGGLDGIITTFAIVAGVAGADLSSDVVLVLGFANLIADGLSMGIGDYLSSQAEKDYAVAERQREAWELENFPEGEKQEMVQIYTSKGFSEEDARNIIDTMAQHRDFFLDHMMVEELGVMPPDPDESPAKNGLVTFISFLVFGFVPLLAYLILNSVDFGDSFNPTFLVSCLMTVLTLGLLGVVKARLANERNRIWATAKVLCVWHSVSKYLSCMRS